MGKFDNHTIRQLIGLKRILYNVSMVNTNHYSNPYSNVGKDFIFV